MTRLTTKDITPIEQALAVCDRQLIQTTGKSLLGIACHCLGKDEDRVRDQAQGFAVQVVPVTSGLGVISRFSETVCAILSHLGFAASVADKTDVSGLAGAYESGADAVMMADDHRFVGINLDSRVVSDNTFLTGQVYAAALELMAGSLEQKSVLVMGCGPVGVSAAEKLLSLGGDLVLYDIEPDVSNALQGRLQASWENRNIQVESSLEAALTTTCLIVEATPCAHTIPDNLICEQMMVAAPGVPLGLSHSGRGRIKQRLVHDKLELGVAAMAVNLLPAPLEERI